MKGATRSTFARPVEEAALRKKHYDYAKLNKLLPPSEDFIKEDQAARNLLAALLASSQPAPSQARENVR
ncbi:hypothetical protein GG496_000979 [Candidatus Fervidibacteria bacterium JGI MDM2 JNZ-1-D12]